jgi:hypothetical protein
LTLENVYYGKSFNSKSKLDTHARASSEGSIYKVANSYKSAVDEYENVKKTGHIKKNSENFIHDAKHKIEEDWKEWGCMALAGCTEWTTRSPRASQPLKIPNKIEEVPIPIVTDKIVRHGHRKQNTDVIAYNIQSGAE